MSMDDVAQALFAPRSIALVGASADEAKHTSLPQRYLRRHGYDKPIYPVNPTRSEIFGERAYRTVADIGEPVDHAFIMVPNPAVLSAVKDCAAAGVRVATILTNGFAESGENGRALQEEVTREARKHGLRILGPNSLGVVSIADRTALSANEVLSLPRLEPGRYGLISQSGSLMGALLSRGEARGFGFSRIVSVGNESDLGVAEIGHFLIDDPHTDAILLFLETIRDAPGVAAMARRAFDARKPVLAFRLGRSALGATLAASHTGALTGDGRAIDAFLQDNGIVRVALLETLLELPTLLVGRRPASGKRVAALTTTGGGGGLVVDSLGERRVDIVAPDERVIRALKAKDIAIGSSPLIDLTLAGTNAATYGAVLAELLASPSCDLVVGVVGSSSQFRPDRAVEPIIAATRADPRKPIAVFLTPQADEAFALLHRNRVAAFLSPESCADAVRAYLDWREPRRSDAKPPDPGALAAAESRELLVALGIEHPPEMRIDPERLDEADVSRLTYPVVAKIASPDIAHKTEAGGVVLGIRSAEELKEACARMLATVRSRRPEARIDAIQVQPMEHGLAEVLVGYRRDPQVGPTITVGAGGILAEIYRDVAVRLAPVDHATAHAMIDEVRGLAPLRGYRSLPRGDLDALARAICALSSLAFLESVVEAEINPLLVKREGEGVVALDGLVVKGER
jgi:acyl-CoA synthetase (NDP forming)